MPRTLDEFITEQKELLKKFEKYWRREHAKDPEMFPLEFEDDNSGEWDEQLSFFEGDEDETA